MTKLYGENRAFTGTAEMRMLQKNETETMRVTVVTDFLDGKERSEMDMSEMKSSMLPAEAAASLKQLGLDKMVTITRPEEQKTYMIYPGLQSYVVMPVEKADTQTDLKIEKSSLGKETIDGKECTKSKLVFTDPKGEKFEAIVWNATALKDFPIQTRMILKDAVVVNRYQEVKFTKPEASRFEVPTKYKKYDSIQGMMAGVMAKIISGGGNE